MFDSSDRDEVWIVAQRTIDGATRRTVEFFERAFVGPSENDYPTIAAWQDAMLLAQRDAFYVDCGLTYDGAPTSVVSGLDHLEGEAVKILADGAVQPDAVVAGGAVSLAVPASKVQVGLAYAHTLRGLKIDAGAQAGTAIGKTKRIHAVTLVLMDSINSKLGPDRQHLSALDFREVRDAMDTAVPLFTGEKYVELPGDYDLDARFLIHDDTPGPFVLLAVAPELKTNEMV